MPPSRQPDFRGLTDVNRFGPEVAEVAYVGQTVQDFAAGSSNQAPSIYTTLMENVAADLALTVLDVIQTLEPVTWPDPIHCLSLDKTIEPGQLIGIVQKLELQTAANLTIRAETALRLRGPEEEEYKQWRVEGEPSYAVRASELDSGFTTASQCVNRLAHVIQAPPGYVTVEKLPKLTFRSQICV